MSEDLLKVGLSDAAKMLRSKEAAFAVFFRRGDFLAELYAPQDVDLQQPHEQDEVYIVATGSGTFLRGEVRVPFVQGDLLFVPAGVAHRFEDFTPDFSTWVIFFGPKGGSTSVS